MRFMASILSFTLTLSLGTHVQVQCETSTCHMNNMLSCCCDMGNNSKEKMPDSCCKTTMKCQVHTIDGMSVSDVIPVVKSAVIHVIYDDLSTHFLKADSRLLTVSSDFSPDLILNQGYSPLLI